MFRDLRLYRISWDTSENKVRGLRATKSIDSIGGTIELSSRVIRVLSWAYLARKTSSTSIFTSSKVRLVCYEDDSVSDWLKGAGSIVEFEHLFVRGEPRIRSFAGRSRCTNRCLHSDWTIFSTLLYLSLAAVLALRKLTTASTWSQRFSRVSFESALSPRFKSRVHEVRSDSAIFARLTIRKYLRGIKVELKN